MLEAYGWNSLFQQAFDALEHPDWLAGRVVAQKDYHYQIITRQGEVTAPPAGVLFHKKTTLDLPAVGDWVAACGTRLDRDRPTRQTSWPGEDPAQPIEDSPITDRDEDFVAYVIADVERRRQLEHDFYANLNPETGEIS